MKGHISEEAIDAATSLVAMDPPAKKMRTSPPTLCDMPNEILALIASNLEPADVFNMVLSSKKIFCPRVSLT